MDRGGDNHQAADAGEGETSGEAAVSPSPPVEYLAPPQGRRIYRPKSEADKTLEKLRKIEDKLYEKAAARVMDGLRAAEIDGTESEPPPEWVAELGEADAKVALRTAKDIRQPPASRPGYFDLAKSVMVGISKSRENRVAAAAPAMNVNIMVAVSTAAYPELEVEEVPGE